MAGLRLRPRQTTQLCLVLHDPESFPVLAHRCAILISDRMPSSSRVPRSSGRRVNECKPCTVCDVSCSEEKEKLIAPLCVTSSTGRLSFTQNRTRERDPIRCGRPGSASGHTSQTWVRVSNGKKKSDMLAQKNRGRGASCTQRWLCHSRRV